MEQIAPAIQKSSERSLKALSPLEFQQTLSAWLQEKRVVQDMKSYLKFQMINVLQNTAIGKDIKRKASQIFTLSQQALHLVVAEYLLHHRCNFALSLFSSEVNLANVLPESKIFNQPENMEETRRFNKANLINILELIGIPKYSSQCNSILGHYFNNSGNSLLSCLLDDLNNFTVKENEEEEEELKEEFEDDFARNIHLALQSCNLPPKTYKELFHSLKICSDLKNKSYETQLVELINQFKNELNIRDKRIHRISKRKKYLENKILKLKEENELNKVARMEKVMATAQCALPHCDNECAAAHRLCKVYEEEIATLKNTDNQQKQEIKRLNLNYSNLVKEFNDYRDKLNLVNVKLQHDISLEKEPKTDDINSSISSSNSVTDEIVQEAKQKLKLLEEESEELDIRFNNFVF